jgi:hypothetical protein
LTGGVGLAVSQDALYVFDTALLLGQHRHCAPQHLEIQLRQPQLLGQFAPARTHEQAIMELEKLSGARFDGMIVRLVARHLKSGKAATLGGGPQF